MMQPPPKPPDPVAEEVKRLHLENLAGKNAKQAADTHKQLASADQAHGHGRREAGAGRPAATRRGS
jgi:hypothetical protein